MPRLTAADKATLAAVRLPRWIDRSTGLKMESMVNPATGKTEKVPTVCAPLPPHLRRKDVKRVRVSTHVRTRLRFVKAGVTLEVTGGRHRSGRRRVTFFYVVKSGSAIFHASKRRRLTIGGTAVLRGDVVMTRAFDPEYWRTG